MNKPASQLNKTRLIVLLMFLLAVSVRVTLFYTSSGSLRHGSASVYGSVALGVYSGAGITYNEAELIEISKGKNNYSGNYLEFYSDRNRERLTEFLPGPAILLSVLWKIIPLYNFAPYILLQILLDSILIVVFYFVLKKEDPFIIFITTLLMIFNLATIKRTLMMGYDFWPQFSVLINFIGIYIAVKGKKLWPLFVTGMVAGLTIWFRSITLFLPFFLCVFLYFYLRRRNTYTFKQTIIKISLYLLPVILSLSVLSVYQNHNAGSYRPTRATFWHSFFVGVGQFSNPYNLVPVDSDIEELGKKLNNSLKKSTSSEMYRLPGSLYEMTLKKEAFHFVRQHPELFLRNIIYRIGIMISPVLYKDGDFIPKGFSQYLFPIGFFLIPLWLIGMLYLFRENNLLFWLSLTIYLYFFSAFAWFMVAGRVILPFMFINIYVYVFGMKFIWKYLKERKMFAKVALR